MSQIFNLRGTPVENVAEVRTNLIKDQTGDHLVMTFDSVSNTVTLHNVEYIWTKNGTQIDVENILLNTP